LQQEGNGNGTNSTLIGYVLAQLVHGIFFFWLAFRWPVAALQISHGLKQKKFSCSVPFTKLLTKDAPVLCSHPLAGNYYFRTSWQGLKSRLGLKGHLNMTMTLSLSLDLGLDRDRWGGIVGGTFEKI